MSNDSFGSDTLKVDIGKDWGYFRLSPVKDIRLIELGDKEYTLAVMVSTGKPLDTALISSKISGQREFCTKRLQYDNRWSRRLSYE